MLEIFCLHPELAPAVLEELPAARLASPAAREIYEAFQRLYTAGEPIEFASVLTALEDPRLKNLLVQLDERAGDKAVHAPIDPAARLAGIQRDFEQRASEPERREKLAALDEKRLQGSEELTVLQQLFEQERRRQGISAPTEG